MTVACPHRMRLALVSVLHAVAGTVIVMLVVVAISSPLLLIVLDLVTEEVTPGLDTLVKSSSSKYTMQLWSIGRIPRGNVPVVAADSLSRMRKGVMQLYEYTK